MKKIFFPIFFLSLAILAFLKPAPSLAMTLYSNDFKSSLSGFEQFFGSCFTSSSGLQCNNPGTGILYLPSLINPPVCISVDVTDPNSSLVSYSALVDNVSTWLINPVYFQFNNNGFLAIRTSSTIVNGQPAETGTHTYMLCKDGDVFTGYVDGNNKVQLMESGHNPTSFAISFDAVNMTNLLVTDTLPNATPTPTPTPTPIQLQVPLVKQAGPNAPWQNTTYDLATIWSPTNYTIGTWGCALTSATMVLQYYSITNLPGNGNLALTPFTLDAWLGTQPDGYIPNGNVNWMAIARLSRLAKKNNATLLDALEYQRSNFMDTTNLLADLQQNHPDILEEPGHFVVATGQNSSNVFTINDPFYNRTDLSSYGNTFLSLGRFIPSFTDLSYMLFTNDPSLTLTLKDSNGNPVGNNYIQQPLSGAGTALSAGSPINLLYLQKPNNGNYTLTISGSINQLYSIKGYLYDVNGNVKPFTETGMVDSNNPNTVTLHFDNQNLANDTTQKTITIAAFLNDLNDLYKLKLVKQGAYEPLKNLGQQVQVALQKHNVLLVKIDLGVIHTLLGIDKSVGLISDSAYQVLLQDNQYLQAHL